MNSIIEKHINQIDYEFINFVINNRDLITMTGGHSILVERQWPVNRKLGLERNGPMYTMAQTFEPVVVREARGNYLVVRVEGVRFKYDSHKGYLYMKIEKEFIRKVREFMKEWKQYLKDSYEAPR